MSQAHHEVAAAIGRKVVRHLESHDRGVEFAIVRSLDPFKVELENAPTVLELGDDFYLTQLVEWWHVNYGIEVGDALLLLRLRNGAWVAFDVRSNRPVEGGVRMAAPALTTAGDVQDYPAHSESGLFTVDQATGAVTWNHHIVKGVPAYDKAGTFLGYVPIFDSLP